MIRMPHLLRLIFIALNGACAGTSVADLPDRAVKDLTGPVCNEGDTDALGEEACQERFADFITRCIASTVRIQVFKYGKDTGIEVYYGTGVIIDDDGLVLTAHHVVKDADFITVTVRRIKADGGRLHIVDHWSYPAKTAYAAPNRDAALLLPVHDQKTARMIALPLRTGVAPMVGETVWHFGQASGVSKGTSDRWPMSSAEVAPVMQTKAPVQLGDSGGPVVTRDGRLIGIVISKSDDEKEPFMYYMPIDSALRALRPWLEKTRVREITITK